MGEGLKRANRAARASRAKPNLAQGMEAVARNLREFGYPDVRGPMIREIYDQWREGKRYPDLPHGVIGALAERQFEENKALLSALSD